MTVMTGLVTAPIGASLPSADSLSRDRMPAAHLVANLQTLTAQPSPMSLAAAYPALIATKLAAQVEVTPAEFVRQAQMIGVDGAGIVWIAAQVAPQPFLEAVIHEIAQSMSMMRFQDAASYLRDVVASRRGSAAQSAAPPSSSAVLSAGR